MGLICSRGNANDVKEHDTSSTAMITDAQPRLFIVASNIQNSNVLTAALLSHVKVLHYNYDTGTLDQLLGDVEAMKTPKFKTIAFACHGREGELDLFKSNPLNLAALEDQNTVRAWKSISAMADRIDFLGCSVAGSDEGIQLINKLEELTRTNFAASSDVTAGTGEGQDATNNSGDMVLETDNIDITDEYFNREKLKLWKHKLLLGAIINGTKGVFYGITGDTDQMERCFMKAGTNIAMDMLTPGLGDMMDVAEAAIEAGECAAELA
eukprot:m.11932 g.11932  ORF g.11932 m.11932 type:complete len:267 (+) comp9227_c0_seq1:163-963(+)